MIACKEMVKQIRQRLTYHHFYILHPEIEKPA
jgi:hypothetical protein